MPLLNDALHADLSGYAALAPDQHPTAPASLASLEPGRSTTLRCPLPPIWQASPDSLRSFYLKGQVPQNRILNPSNATTASAGGATSGEVTLSGGNGGGSGSSTSTSAAASVTTGVLGPNLSYLGMLTAAEAFLLLSVAAASPCRVRLYGTAAAQASDLARGLDVPPPAGTAQNILCDVALDTVPYQWTFQNRAGANGDTPQTPLVYVTVTNIAASSVPITVTLQYVPLESE